VRARPATGSARSGRGIRRGNGNGPDIAWFADPAGNIPAVLTG
jgi:hypothetical protein